VSVIHYKRRASTTRVSDVMVSHGCTNDASLIFKNRDACKENMSVMIVEVIRDAS
jgi:hypothetical protein